MKTYKVSANTGISYNFETPDDLIKVLDNCYKNKIRVVVDLGDVETGKSWNETFETKGYIGRSTGTNKIPLLVYNSRSMGGGGLLTHCILTVKTTKGGKLLYSKF